MCFLVTSLSNSLTGYLLLDSFLTTLQLFSVRPRHLMSVVEGFFRCLRIFYTAQLCVRHGWNNITILLSCQVV